MIKAYYNEIDRNAAAWLRQLIKDGLITDGEVDERSITEVEASDLVGFNRVHLFAGIGTWDYCLNQAGWGEAPVLTASLPCQPFSVAGKGLGKEDVRHLLPHAIDLIKQSGIATCFGEQVTGAIKHGWLDDLYAEMEAAGYSIGTINFGAHSIGAPHIRQRLYWVAHSINDMYQREIGRSNGKEKISETSNGKNVIESRQFGGTSGHVLWMADTINTRQQGRIPRREDERREVIDGYAGCCGSDSGLGIPNSDRLQQRSKATETARHGDAVDAASGIDCRMEFSESEQMGIPGQPRERRETDAIDWLYCRDNKYRPVKSGSIKMAHGLTAGVVCGCNTGIKIDKNQQEKKINDSEHKTNTGEELPVLWQENGKEKDKFTPGGFGSFQEKEILQQGLHGEGVRRGDEGSEFKEFSQAIKEDGEGELRGVWKNNFTTCSSCGRKSYEQLSIEFDDVVFSMPQGSTLETFFCSKGKDFLRTLRKASNEEQPLLDSQHPLSEVWQSLDDEEKDRVRVAFNNRAWILTERLRPLVNGASEGVVYSGNPCQEINAECSIEARAMRLKGYGNAIVAGCGIAFISAFMDVME